MLLGNGRGFPITSIGSSYFTSSNTTHTPLTLKNLLLVPHITKNLIFVSKFAKDIKLYFEFHADKCLFKNNSEVVLQGSLNKDGLYTFGALQPIINFPATSDIIKNSSLNTTSLNSSSYTLWHNRLGHPHHEALKSILDIC